MREPQGRMGKQGRGGREAIEKQRLAQRVEGFERYEDPGKLTEVSLSLSLSLSLPSLSLSPSL